MRIPQSKTIHTLINQTAVKRFLTTYRTFVKTYFNLIYLSRDPYNSSDTQAEKTRRAFQFVHHVRARSALEIGCGEGRWTPYLVPISEQILAVDISDVAIRRARKNNCYPEKIEFQQADIFADTLPGKYDLIYCSEMLCYLERPQLLQTVPKIIDLLNADGLLLLVHHRSIKDDSSGLALKEIGAKTIHELFISRPELALERDVVEHMYRISLLRRAETTQ